MAWDGNGNFEPSNGRFSGNNIFQRLEDSREFVRGDRIDAFARSLKAGLENCVTRDGQTPATGDVPMGANKLTGLGDGAARDDAVSLGQLNGRFTFVSPANVGGTVDAITLGPSPAFTSWPEGGIVAFFAKGTNTGEVTAALNALTAVAVVKTRGSVQNQPLEAGDIVDGGYTVLAHDGARVQLLASGYAERETGQRTIQRAAALVWNVGQSPSARVVLTGDVTGVALQGDVDGGVYTLEIVQDGTGGRSFGFPAAWKWAGGTVQDISDGANETTLMTIRRVGSSVVVAPLLRELS